MSETPAPYGTVTRLAVVLVTYNRADFIERCIASICSAARPGLLLRIIVMENGSSDGAPEVLARVAAAMPEFTQLDVRRTEDNRPVPGVLNRGFAAAYEQPSDYIIMMNDDTEFTPGSLETLMAAARANPNGMLTPLQRNYREPEHVDANCLKLAQRVGELLEDLLLGRPLQQVYPLPTISGAAMLARTEVWQHLGEWDECFWFYGIDDDMCTRARWHGYNNLLVPASHLLHAHGKLGARPAEQNKAGQRRKWQLETQARFWFCLKDPAVPFWRAFLRLKWLACKNFFECLLARWPWGALHSLLLFLWFATRLPRLADTRRRHFNVAGTPR